MSTVAPLRPDVRTSPARPAPVGSPAKGRTPQKERIRRPAAPGRKPSSRRPPVRRPRQARQAATSGLLFAVMVIGLLVAGLVAILVVNTLIAQDAFTRTDLVKQQTALHDQEEQLRRQVAYLEAPSQLARRAQQLGMVSTSGPQFLRLRDHRILGVAEAAKAGPVAAPVLPKKAGAQKPVAKQPVAKQPVAKKPIAETSAGKAAVKAAKPSDKPIAKPATHAR